MHTLGEKLLSQANNGVDVSQQKSIYLANPYGFSLQQRDGPLVVLVEALETLGIWVWEPFSQNDQSEMKSLEGAHRIGQSDLEGVRDADGFFGVVNGCPPDEGVVVELGMAIAWKKPIFLFRDDFRTCTDSSSYPLNLMLFTGLPKIGWRTHWYESVKEIANPDKALVQWVNSDKLP